MDREFSDLISYPLFCLSLQQLIQHGLGDLHSNHLPAHSDDTVGKYPFFDDNLAPLMFLDLAAHFQFDAKRRGFEVINVQ